MRIWIMGLPAVLTLLSVATVSPARAESYSVCLTGESSGRRCEFANLEQSSHGIGRSGLLHHEPSIRFRFFRAVPASFRAVTTRTTAD
jgi:hypothetical protein